MFKFFKTKEEIEYGAFCKGLYSMSRSVKSMIDICKEQQKKYPKIMTDKHILHLIEKTLIFKRDK